MKKKCVAMMLIAIMTASLAGCGSSKDGSGKSVKLDSDHPVSLTIWHYYNGAQQAMFDTLVKEFNSSIGKEEGIYVESYSQGSVSDLEEAVNSSLNGEVGAEELPDIFSSYSDTAYAVQKQDKLADLSVYFTEDELSRYVDSYIQEGYFNQDGALYLFPVAKSTEITMINKTDWEPFAEATGTTVEELATTEGITEVAQRYYEWTDSLTDAPNDGKALFGRDAMANYMIIGAKQLGCDIFETKDGQTTVNLPREVAKRLWDHYYVPYVKGYFSASGRFRSDDMKTGNVLAFVGSSAGCTFFPDHVTRSDEESYPIEIKTYPAPKFEGGGDYAVQQGAGMVVIRKSDEQVEAAARFLKWFTQSDWAIEFSVTSGYLPVTAEDNDMVKIEKDSPSMKKNVRDSLSTAVQVVRQNTLYTSKAFKNGMSARKKLEYAMSDAAKADRQRVVEAIENGATQEAAVAAFVSEERFDAWYAQLMDELNELAAQ